VREKKSSAYALSWGTENMSAPITTNRIAQRQAGELFYTGKICERHPKLKGQRCYISVHQSHARTVVFFLVVERERHA
jgi:hypothetical protein